MRQHILVFALLCIGAIAQAQNCNALFTFGSTGLTIHFTDQSTHATNDPIVSWTWDFDDGAISHLQNPTHTFPVPDHYDVTLTIITQSGCSDNVQIRIEICDFGVTYTIGACNAQGFAPVTLNITDIFDNAKESGMKYFFVEQDGALEKLTAMQARAQDKMPVEQCPGLAKQRQQIFTHRFQLRC